MSEVIGLGSINDFSLVKRSDYEKLHEALKVMTDSRDFFADRLRVEGKGYLIKHIDDVLALQNKQIELLLG